MVAVVVAWRWLPGIGTVHRDDNDGGWEPDDSPGGPPAGGPMAVPDRLDGLALVSEGDFAAIGAWLASQHASLAPA